MYRILHLQRHNSLSLLSSKKYFSLKKINLNNNITTKITSRHSSHSPHSPSSSSIASPSLNISLNPPYTSLHHQIPPPLSQQYVQTTKNPLSFFQRIKFYLTPVSDVHRSKTPISRNIEIILNRFYLYLRLFIITRSYRQWLGYCIILYCSYTFLPKIYNKLFILTKKKVIPGYEYGPLLPEKSMHRSALLPHTLPPHLTQHDSAMFVKDVGYQPSQESFQEDPTPPRQRELPRFAGNTKPHRSYLKAIQ